MTIDDKITNEKLQYDINREAANISAWSSGKFYKYEYLPVAFLRDTHDGSWSLEDANKRKIQLANEFKDMGEGKIPVEKRALLKNAVLLISARKKYLNNFKGKIFRTKNPELTLEPEPEQESESTAFATPEPSKETAKISQCRLYKDFFEKLAHYEANV